MEVGDWRGSFVIVLDRDIADPAIGVAARGVGVSELLLNQADLPVMSVPDWLLCGDRQWWHYGGEEQE